MLHNPDRVGYTSPVVWEAMAALRSTGLALAIGVAPGPANGFTLDVIDCVERFGDTIDWAMLILNPLEPWPGSLALPACVRNDVQVIARVVDYGGLFHDDLRARTAWESATTAPSGRRAGSGRARTKLDRLRPVAAAHDLTLLQLACAWTLAQPAVATAAPTLIQESGADARPIEAQREELADAPAAEILSQQELVRDLRDRRQHRVDGAQGRIAELRRRRAAGRLAADRRPAPTAARWDLDPERDLTLA